MKHALTIMLALILSSCTDAHEPAEPVVTMACIRSFATTLAEWERNAGERVPKQCQFLDADYEVQLVSAADMPRECISGGEGTEVVGCTLGGVIYLLDSRDAIERVDTSVHEWVHALSQCVYGDVDQYHLRAGLWASSGAESTEVQAQAAAVLGECL